MMSILLGLCAWGIPIASILTRHYRTGFSAASFGLCSASLLFQIFELRHRIFIQDYSALEDTIHTVVLASMGLMCICLLLNSAAYVISKLKD
jgi:hypothetical protein